MQIHHSNEGGSGAWVQLSNETSKGLVSSGHVILVDSRFELPSGMSQQKKALGGGGKQILGLNL